MSQTEANAEAKAEENDSDPSRLAEPFVDTSIKVKGYPLFRWAKYAFPGALVFVFAVLIGLFTQNLGIAGAGIPIAVAVAAAGLSLTVTTDYETSHPYDRLRGGIVDWLAERKYPMTNEEAAADPVHGVKRIMDSGKAQMEDNRMVAYVGVEGRNTDKIDSEEEESMVAQWASGIRREMDSRFRVYLSTFPTDASEFVEKYEKQVFSERFSGDQWVWMRELLHSIIKFEEKEADRWDAREMKTYVEVEIRPHEVDSERKGSSESISDVFDAGQNTELTAYQRKQMISELNDRIRDARRAVQSVSGCSPYVVGPAEHAMIVSDRWCGAKTSYSDTDVTSSVNAAVFPSESDYGKTEDEAESFRPAAVEGSDTPDGAVASIDTVQTNQQAVADGGETIQQKAKSLSMADVPDELFNSEEDAEDASYLARVRDGLFNPVADGDEQKEDHDPVKADLSPGHYDAADDVVVTGDRFSRTYWLMNLDSMPNVNFLKQLQEDIQGLDFDLRLIADPIGRDDAEYRLQKKVESSNASMEELEEIRDISAEAMTEDVDYLMTMYLLVKKGYVRAWDFNGYLTVHAGEEKALAKAKDRIDKEISTDDIEDDVTDVDRREALIDDTEEMLNIVENYPANLSPVFVKERADELFRSGSPGQRDIYNENSAKEKSSVVLTATLGSAFLFGREAVENADGIEYGRLMQTARKLVSDPYDHDGPAHKLIMGDSGSGKSVKSGTDALRYWLANDDATVIYGDTQGGFRPHIHATKGQHIVVDGSTTLNPFDIEQTPEAMRDGSEISPFDMSVDGAVTWICRIIEAQGADSDDFVQLIEDITREIYKAEGILPGQPETHGKNEPPTMREFIDSLKDLMDEDSDAALDYTLTGMDAEAEEIREKARKLSRKLNQFKSDGKYRHLVGQTDKKIRTGEVNYLDMQQVEGQGDAEKSTMLYLMLQKIYEAVKRAEGPVIVLIDEAHYLLHDEEMTEWLQRAARHWRHHGAGLWLASQNPDDFVSNGSDDGESTDHKDTIRGQVPITEWFRVDGLEWKTAKKYDMNYKQYNWISDTAIPGSSDGINYATGMTRFKDRKGYRRYEVHRSDFELALATYKRKDDGNLHEYLQRNQKYTDPVPEEAIA